MSLHPASHFIRYLLVAQEDISLDSVNSTLEMYGLAEIALQDFAVIRQEMGDPPESFKPWDKRDISTNRWLRSKHVHSLVHPDRATKEMKDKILTQPRLRRSVESLLLGNVSSREASYRLRKLGYPLSDTAIEEFRHYFWDTSALGVEDWAAYFETDAHADKGTGRTAYNNDLYKTALHAGAEVAMYRVGIRKTLDGQKILEEVQEELYHTFKETASLPLSLEKVKMLAALTRGLSKVDERIQAGDQALHDILKKFEKFRVVTDDSKVPSLIELAPTGSISDKTRAEILHTREN